MVPRFTLAGLLLWVALVALVAQIVVPLYRWRYRSPVAGVVAALDASADGSTFAALLGDGTVLVWDGTGKLKTTLRTFTRRSLTCQAAERWRWRGTVWA